MRDNKDGHKSNIDVNTDPAKIFTSLISSLLAAMFLTTQPNETKNR